MANLLTILIEKIRQEFRGLSPQKFINLLNHPSCLPTFVFGYLQAKRNNQLLFEIKFGATVKTYLTGKYCLQKSRKGLDQAAVKWPFDEVCQAQTSKMWVIKFRDELQNLRFATKPSVLRKHLETNEPIFRPHKKTNNCFLYLLRNFCCSHKLNNLSKMIQL